MKIDKFEMLMKICVAYPGFRDRIASSADSWISVEGKFMWGVLIGLLSGFIFSKIEGGDYNNLDELFSCVDELIDRGDEEVISLVTTELLEGMLNSRTVDSSLWRPLLGEKASMFCDDIDSFYS